MFGVSWLYILPMALTTVLTATGTWITAYMTMRTTRRTQSGTADTSDAREVFQGDWRIIGWQDGELNRLRQVEERYRACQAAAIENEARIKALEARLGP